MATKKTGSKKTTKKITRNVTLIVPGEADDFAAPADRGGGETQGLKAFFKGKAQAVAVDEKTLKENVRKTMENIADVLSDASKSASKHWKIDSVKVGLALSAEGSIGIATAGVETTVEVTFSPK